MKTQLALITAGMLLSFTMSAQTAGQNEITTEPHSVNQANPQTKPWKPLKCVNVNNRWGICAGGSTNRFVAGFQVRFAKVLPNGTFVATGETHTSCAAAIGDPAIKVPPEIRHTALASCKEQFERPLSIAK